MKEGDYVTVCTCLLLVTQPHITATKADGTCLYCGYASYDLKVSVAIIKKLEQREIILKDIKWQRLELMVKEARHGYKIN